MIDYTYIERELLGCALLHNDRDQLAWAVGEVTPCLFKSRWNRICWTAITSIIHNGGDIDLVGVHGAMNCDVGLDWVIELTQESSGLDSMLSGYVERVKQSGYHHKLVDSLQKSLEQASRLSDLSLINELESNVIESVTANSLTTSNGDPVKFDILAKGLVDDMTAKLNGDKSAETLKTGINDIDRMTGGFDKTDFIVIAAPSGGGKTELAMKVISSVAKRKVPSLVFSMEMSGKQVVGRSLASEAGISVSKLRSPDKMREADWGSLSVGLKNIKDCDMYIQDKAGLTIADVRPQCVRFKAKHPNVGMIMIDQLSLFKRRGFNANTEYGEITGALKVLAKDLEVPIVLLAQLNTKTIASRKIDDRRPVPSDIKDCSKVYEDVDWMILIYLACQYDDRAPKVAEIILGKARQGVKGDTAYCGWHNGHFTEMEQHVGFNQMDQYEKSTKNVVGSKQRAY